MPLSLSTSWVRQRGESPFELLSEMRGLGFESVELYCHWLPRQLPEIKRAIDELALTVSSLHGPCPVPANAQGEAEFCGDWLAEITPWKRQFSVDAHRRTIDFAAEVGARGVVVHLGKSGSGNVQRPIFQAIRDHGAGSPQHLAAVETARAKRQRTDGNGALEAAILSARELGEHARGTGVSLGLEIRDGYDEVPTLDEFPLVFEACDGLPVFYWHDMGHGSKLENAGLLRAVDYLERFGDRLLGVHLHDTVLDRDHDAPGDGDTDFSIILPYLKTETLRTIELNPRVPADRIRPAVELLTSTGIA